MKIIVVNDHIVPNGGADIVALSSAVALAQANVDVTFFSADQWPSSVQSKADFRMVSTHQDDWATAAGAPDAPAALIRGLWNRSAAKDLLSLLAGYDPAETVIHVHSWTKALSSSIFRSCLQAGFRFVVTLHDFVAFCPNGLLFDYGSHSICHRTPMSIACVCANCDPRSAAHKIFRVTRQLFQNHVGLQPKQLRDIIFVSQFSRDIIQPWLSPSTSVHLVRNPIDVAQDRCTDVASNTAFLMVGRICEQKGQALFLEACEQANVPAVCVGDGDQRVALQARYPTARFTGMLGHDEVKREMRKARAVVMPSLSYETQGLVVAEAAALGVPAIVSDRCAATDFVDHERSGLHFHTGDVTMLAEALQRLSCDSTFAARLGSAAYEIFWRAPSTPAVHARQLMGIYEQILTSTE